jgi:hypothetical protein
MPGRAGDVFLHHHLGHASSTRAPTSTISTMMAVGHRWPQDRHHGADGSLWVGLTAASLLGPPGCRFAAPGVP